MIVAIMTTSLRYCWTVGLFMEKNRSALMPVVFCIDDIARCQSHIPPKGHEQDGGANLTHFGT